MANPQTTHVIEIESGIGEPAFIPLSMGHELQPISVGKKGMWRLESPRVLDVHAFVYFDGTSLFLQSADEQNAAAVDGFRVGKAWTELHAPCTIEVGMARLRFRSLLADADSQPTQMHGNPPVQAPPGGPGGAGLGSRPGATAPAPPGQPQRIPSGQMQQQNPGSRMQGQPPASNPPIAFPKAERPFKPGEFSSAADEGESTRIAPLDASGGGRTASGSNPKPPLRSLEDPDTRPDAARVPMRANTGAIAAAPPGAPYGAVNGPPGGSGMMMPMVPVGGPPGAMDYHPGAPPQDPQQGYGGQPQGFAPPYPPQGYPSGAPGVMPPIPGPPGMPQGSLGPSMPPGGFGSMTPQGGMQQQPPANGFVATLKANSIPKIIAGLLFIIGGILYLAEDDEPQPPPRKKPVATADAGTLEGGVAASTGTGAPTTPPVMPPPPPPVNAWPPNVPCPPPNWPPNTPLPCTPNAAGSAAAAGNNDPTPPPRNGREPREPKDAGAPFAAGTKTLERQAVDAVASGDTVKAAASYEELSRRDPNNKVYAEAARILRAKLDGGVPGQ
jgi:hypothetical protein